MLMPCPRILWPEVMEKNSHTVKIVCEDVPKKLMARFKSLAIVLIH